MVSTRKTHRFPKSKAYSANRGCPSGYHKRASYKSSTGRYVPARCVRATTKYPETSAEFKRRTLRRASSRLARMGATPTTVNNTKKVCPSGKILRRAYVRKYGSSVVRRGYTVKRGDKKIKVFPKPKRTLVKAACIEDRGMTGKGPVAIGPLRRGELLKHGYSFRKPSTERHEALQKAVKEYGALGTFRKLNAVAKLTVRTVPDASKVFKADRDWVREKYSPLKAF